MATITTTTNTTPLIWPSTTLIDRDTTTGNLYALVRASAADTFEIWRSINNGSTWTLLLSVVRTAVQEIGSIFVHPEGWLYWCYRTSESSQDRIWFRRADLTAAAWQAELLVANPANGVHIGGMDLQVVRTPTAGHYIAIGCGLTVGATIGLQLYGVYISPSTGIPVVSHSIIAGTRQWLATGTGRVTPSLDIEHVGNAKGANAPHLWVAWGRTNLYTVKCAWTGAGWSGPTAVSTLNPVALTPAQDSITARWDGDRFVVAVPDPVATSTVTVYERDRANSATTVRATPVHTAGVVKNCSLSYNAISGDMRVYAVGTSNNDLYYVDFIRATGLWSSWATVSTTDILGAAVNNYSIRRSSDGNARYDVLTAHSGSPNTIVHTQQSLSYAPNTPTLDIASMAVNSGAAADVAATRLLDWVFSDPDPADVQSAYAVSRQIGAGALNYWRASDSTWQVAEVKNVSATTAITLPTSWGSASDAATTFKVKVWDSADVASSYSDGFVVIPSAKVNPTITAPTPAQVLTTAAVTATWTVSEQTAYRVTLATNPGGVVLYDSGWVASAALSLTVPLSLADLSGWTLSLQTRNLEGLPSNVVTVDFTVDYLEPPAATTVATPLTATGAISVAITNPAPTGGQPALASQDLYRRPVASAFLATHGFEIDLSGWVAVGGGGAAPTITRDSAQAHEGAWSMKIVPGGGAWAAGETTAFIPATAGQQYTAAAWIYTVTANKPATMWIHWFTAGSVFISSTTALVSAVAGAWLYVSVTGTPPPTATKFVIGAGLSSTPAGGDISYVDEVRARLADPSVGVRVAAGLASGATVEDWRAVSGIDYEYRAEARGVNNTTHAGAWKA